MALQGSPAQFPHSPRSVPSLSCPCGAFYPALCFLFLSLPPGGCASPPIPNPPHHQKAQPPALCLRTPRRVPRAGALRPGSLRQPARCSHMKRRTVQTYRAAGRRDALWPAPGSAANRSQWTHNWENPAAFLGLPGRDSPEGRPPALRARCLPGRPDGRRCSSSLTPLPPEETGPRPYLAPQRDQSRSRRLRAALRGNPLEAAGAPGRFGASSSVTAREVRSALPSSLCLSGQHQRSGTERVGRGRWRRGKRGARSMRGAAGGRPGQRPPRRAPPGFCRGSPRTLEHFCSESQSRCFQGSGPSGRSPAVP